MVGVARALAPLTLAVYLCIVAAAPAHAATGAHDGGHAAGPVVGATITGIQAGYTFNGGGNFRVNGPSVLQPGAVWVPIRVTLRNDDPTTYEGRVVVTDDPQQNSNTGPSYHTDYTQDVALPQGARKAVTLYIRAADIASQLTVALQVSGRTVDSRPIAISAQQGDALSVGVLSDGAAARPAFQQLKFGDTTLAAAQFSDAGMPLDTQPQALDNFDLIVLSDYSSNTLTGPQLDALRAWVDGGGTLLEAGGADVQKTIGPLPADLQAVTGGTVSVVPALPEVASLAGVSAGGGGQAELSAATPRPGARVLATHHGVPLIVDLPVGRGHLVYSAIEPTAPPLSALSPQAQSAFWERMLTPALQGARDALVQSNAQTNATSFGPPGQNTNSGLTNDVGTVNTHGELPAFQIYVFLIVLYVLVLGPGNFLLLRWRRRLEWSWVTVPVVAVLFGVGSFGLAYARNGGDVLTNVDSVVYLDPGAHTMQADSYVGLFAPFRGDYDLTTPDSTLIWALGNDSSNPTGLSTGGTPLGMTVNEGPQSAAHLIGLQMWSQRNIGLHNVLPQRGSVTGQLTLHGKTVDGTITNHTTLTLADCIVAGANGVSAVLPTIAPGQTVRVRSFSIDSGAGTSASPGINGTGTGPLDNPYAGLAANGKGAPGSAGRYNAVLNAVFPSGSAANIAAPLVLIGWSNAPIGAFSVNGATPRRTDLDLVVAPLGMAAAPGRFTIAPGDLPVGVVATTVNEGGSDGITLNAGDRLDVQAVLPAVAGAGRVRHVDTLSLQVNPTNGSYSLGPSDAQLWDWQTGRWRPVNLSNGSLDVHNAAPYIAPDGRVLLRLDGSSNGGITINNVDQSIGIGASGSVS